MNIVNGIEHRFLRNKFQTHYNHHPLLLVHIVPIKKSDILYSVLKLQSSIFQLIVNTERLSPGILRWYELLILRHRNILIDQFA